MNGEQKHLTSTLTTKSYHHHQPSLAICSHHPLLWTINTVAQPGHGKSPAGCSASQAFLQYIYYHNWYVGNYADRTSAPAELHCVDSELSRCFSLIRNHSMIKTHKLDSNKYRRGNICGWPLVCGVLGSTVGPPTCDSGHLLSRKQLRGAVPRRWGRSGDFAVTIFLNHEEMVSSC